MKGKRDRKIIIVLISGAYIGKMKKNEINQEHQLWGGGGNKGKIKELEGTGGGNGKKRGMNECGY